MSKFTVSEYLKRLTCNIWTRRYEVQLMGTRIFLAVTFAAVVIATLAECQPFHNYWQVVPDPGSRCRSGYAQLLVMSCCDIISDILLIIFPIPIIVNSAMPPKRKFTITFLFSLSALLIAITSYRVSTIVRHSGRQQLRTLWASLEILASAAVSNVLILGSFVRDRGVKKAKYKGTDETTGRSASDANDAQSNLVRAMTRRHWGTDSDEDLFKHCRGRLGSVEEEGDTTVTPAPMVAKPPLPSKTASGGFSPHYPNAPAFFGRPRKESSGTSVSQGVGEVGSSPSLFDVGGMLEDQKDSLSKPASSHDGSVVPLDPSKQRMPPTSEPRPFGTWNGTNALDFADIGGLLGTRPQPQQEPRTIAGAEEEVSPRASKRRMSNFSMPFTSPAKRRSMQDNAPERTSTELQDIGGLLGSSTTTRSQRRSSRSQYPPEVSRLSDASSLFISPASPRSRPRYDTTEVDPFDTSDLNATAPNHEDERQSRGLDPSSSESTHSSPARKSRSRPSSLLRTALRTNDRAPSSGQQPASSRASSQRRTRSQSRSRIDPATAALGLIANDTSRRSATPARNSRHFRDSTPHHDDTIPEQSTPEHRSVPHRPPTSNFSKPLPPPPPPADLSKRESQDSIDTRAHARDWLSKIKAARERQNENHGMTRDMAMARGGEGDDGIGMDLSDVGGLLELNGQCVAR